MLDIKFMNTKSENYKFFDKINSYVLEE